MSRIRHAEKAYAMWKLQRDQYLIGVLRDYRTLGIIISQLVMRRLLEPNEVSVFRRKDFTFTSFTSEVSMDKYPMALCDLLKCCFSSSPYEVYALGYACVHIA